MNHHGVGTFGITAALALALVGCVAPPPTAPVESPPTTSLPSQDSPYGEWLLVEAKDSGSEVSIVAEVELQIAHGIVSGQICNGFGSEAEVDIASGTLQIGNVAQTLMMCSDENIMTMENWFTPILSSLDRFSFDGDQLVLSGEERELRFVAIASESLDGEWTLYQAMQGYPKSEQEIIIGDEEHPLTITIQNGELSGSGGCNTFSAQSQITGKSIAITQLEHTEIGCSNSDLSEREQWYFTTLSTVNRFFVANDILTLHTTDGYRLLFNQQ